MLLAKLSLIILCFQPYSSFNTSVKCYSDLVKPAHGAQGNNCLQRELGPLTNIGLIQERAWHRQNLLIKKKRANTLKYDSLRSYLCSQIHYI